VTLNPDGAGLKDFSLFQDDDGTAYVVYVDGTQNTQHISKLSANYLSSTGQSIITPAGGREAPVIVKRGGTYFLVASETNYYDSTTGTFQLMYWTCPSCATPLGSWNTNYSFLFSPVPSANQPYNCQTSAVLNILSRQDAFLLLCDFFNPTELYDSRQSWTPLTFPTSTTVRGTASPLWDLTIWAPAPKPSISSGSAFR
jgi:hypothetical protein